MKTDIIAKRDPDVKPDGYSRVEWWMCAEKRFIEIANSIRHEPASKESLEGQIVEFAASFPICLGFIRQLKFLLFLREEGQLPK